MLMILLPSPDSISPPHAYLSIFVFHIPPLHRPTMPLRRAPRPQSSRGTTVSAARCTTCDRLFPDARSLAQHFIDSPAHPFTGLPPPNSWSSPIAKDASILASGARKAPAASVPTKTKRQGDATKARIVKCQCGKSFKTSDAMKQHMRDSRRHKSAEKEIKGKLELDGNVDRDDGIDPGDVDDIASALASVTI